MMEKIINYFTPKGKQNLLEKQKTKAFIIIGFFGFLISFVMLVKGFIVRGDNFILNVTPPLILAFFILIILFILKKTNIKLAGNIFSLGIVLIIAIVINIINEDVSIIYKFAGGFYTILGLYSMGVIFASRKIILINATIILFTTTRIFFYVLEHNLENLEILKSGYVEHTTALIITTLALFFASKFTENAINSANKEAKINKEQNQILLKLIGGIKTSSGQISQAGDQLSSISQQISQSANEQAATTEEVSAAMEQMLSIISDNTERANDTGKLSSNSAKEMKQSNDIFLKTLQAVSEISEKISIITEIAGKTDLLSINASIEAARAGEVGKGFSVVASEIRKLADKTKIASDQITELSQNGQDISKVAGEKLAKTIPEILKSAELVNQIVLASREQKDGAEMINNSMQQLVEITNNNSASSEEMSASAEELSAQAEQLNQMLLSFKLVSL